KMLQYLIANRPNTVHSKFRSMHGIGIRIRYNWFLDVKARPIKTFYPISSTKDQTIETSTNKIINTWFMNYKRIQQKWKNQHTIRIAHVHEHLCIFNLLCP